MGLSLLIYVDTGILNDELLTFNDIYVPEHLNTLLTKNRQFDNIIYSVPEEYSGKLQGTKGVISRTGSDTIDFWKQAFQQTGADTIIKVYADAPFLDAEIIEDMIQHHTGYGAEYTYSWNLPEGYACEVYSKELIDSVPASYDKELSFRQIIQSNINQFDVELYFRNPDLRQLRLSFRSSDTLNNRVMKNIIRVHGGIPPYAAIESLVKDNPDVLRVAPTYIELELYGGCQLDCVFCYRNTLDHEHGPMTGGTLDTVLEGVDQFALPTTVCLGGSGEPLMHENFYAMLKKIAETTSVDTVVIETNGILADGNYATALQSLTGARVITIVNINGINSDTYQSIHGADYFDTVNANVTRLRDALKDTTHQLFVQVMKINETEPHLDQYYDFWEKQQVSIILQKQNTCLGRIEDRRYSDLTPFERTPCWHLQRDMYILYDGTVAFCKQDVDGKNSAGSLAEKSMVDIWKDAAPAFLNDYRGRLSTSPDCAVCDEWFTFNF